MATSTLTIPPPVFEDPFVERDGRLSSEAFKWFQINLLPRIQQTAPVLGTTPALEQENLTAALPTTSLPVGTLSTGLYRVMVYLRVTTPDGVSSSVAPVVGFIDDGVACTIAGAALTSDAIDAPASYAFFVSVDQPGPITLATTYASGTPNQMAYKISATCERVQ